MKKTSKIAEYKKDILMAFPFLKPVLSFFDTSLIWRWTKRVLIVFFIWFVLWFDTSLIWRWTKRVLIVFFIWFVLWGTLITHIEPTEAGIAINWFNGDLRLLDRAGWHITAPWVWVCKVETTPMRVSISTASRGYSSKLVQFNKDYYKEFVNTEGWYYYWWYNRLSFNIGYDRNEEYRGFRDVMRAYAYSAKKYPFIITMKEYDD